MKKILLFLAICINIFCTNKKSSTVADEIKDKEILRLAKIEPNMEDYDKIYDLLKKKRIKELNYILKNNKYIDKMAVLYYAIENDYKDIIKEILKSLNNEEKLRALEYLLGANNKELMNLVFENKVNINGYDTDENRLWEYLLFDYTEKDDFLEKINFLISKGLDLNTKSMYGDTILTKIFDSNDINRELWTEIFEVNGIEKLINVKSDDNESPLELALSYHGIDEKTIKLLILKGADIKLKDFEGREVIFKSLEIRNKEIVNSFLSMGADVNAIDNNSKNLLSYAVNNSPLEIIELLVEKGADINQIDNDGKGPIHYLLRDRYIDDSKEEILDFFFKKNIDLNVRDFEGNTLSTYIRYCDEVIKKMVIKKYVELNSPLLKEMMIEFVKNGDIESLNYLLESYEIDQKILNELSDYVHEDISGQSLIFLLKSGADVKYFNENHGTYIFSLIATYEYIGTNSLLKLLDLGIGYEQLNYDNENILTYSIITNKNEVAKMIIDKKLKKDWRDGNGETPLTVAAKNNNFDMIKYLLSSGEDINETDNQQRNALMITMDEKSYDGNYSYFDALYFLEKGIDINHRDDKGLNLLSYAAFGGSVELIEKLVKMGIEVDGTDDFGNKPLLYARGKEKFEYLLNLTKNIDYKGKEGENYIKNAIDYSDYEVFILLIEKGVPIKAEYIDFAVENMEFYNKKIIGILLKNIKNGFDMERLFIKALYNNDIENMETLVARGYNINKKNECGQTPMDIANSEDLYLAKEFLNKKLKASKKK